MLGKHEGEHTLNWGSVFDTKYFPVSSNDPITTALLDKISLNNIRSNDRSRTINLEKRQMLAKNNDKIDINATSKIEGDY